jgi:predicted CXXCH cytochrome family protein
MRFKKLLLIGVGSALMFTMGGVGPASADTTVSTHKSTAAAATGVAQLVSVGGGRCAGCHRAHTAKAEYLLKQAQPALCYTCHGGAGSALDVVDGVAAGTTNALRGGGFAYALINGAGATMTVSTPDPVTLKSTKAAVDLPGASAPVTSRHQIDGTTQGTIWGNGAISDTVGDPLAAGKTGVTLECGSCHDPHGNGNYRILRPIPNDAATKAAAAVPAVAASLPGVLPVVLAQPAIPAVAAVVVLPVAIPDAVGTRQYTTTDYWNVNDPTVPNVAGGALPNATGVADGYIQNVAAWCTTCHTRYLAGSGAWNTPNAGYVAGATNGTGTNATTGKVDATFTYRHRSESAGTTPKPNCIQCHVSHGTSANMTGYAASFTAPNGLIPAAGLGTAGFDPTTSLTPGAGAVGTSRLLRVDNRGTCEMCHNV